MATDFRFPDVGEGISEGKLVEWLVDEGDEVEEDEDIAKVETDKAVVDIPSPEGGEMVELHAERGETVHVGDVIATIREPSEEEEEAEPEAPEPEEAEEEQVVEEKESEEAVEKDEVEEVKATPRVRKYAEENDVDLSKVEATGSHGQVTEEDVDRFLESEEESREEEKPGRVLATPSVRKYAKKEGVDLKDVKGTGPAGRVTREDVERHIGKKKPSEPSPKERKKTESGLRHLHLDDYEFEKYGDVEREEVSSTRKAISRNMVESKYTAPHVSATMDAKVDELWEVMKKEKPNAEEEGAHLTFLPFVVKAVVSALKDYPLMNSSFDESKGEVVKKDYYNIGIAVDTEQGLMAPVIKDADEKSVIEIADEIHSLAEKARNGELSLEDTRGHTFTITNYGSIGGDYGSPIINYPDVGILGLGRVEDKPVVEDGEVVPRKIAPLSLTFDHRIIDGAYGSRFLTSLRKHLEDPDLMLIED